MSEDAPWSEIVSLAEVSRGPVTRVLNATEADRKRIARALGIDQLDQLEAKVTLTSWLDGAELDGRWTASIEQTCGLSLDRFASELEGAFLLRVLPDGSPNAPRETGPEVAVDPDAEDPADVLEGEDVDVAAYVVEHLAMEIDPFPRKPGAAWQAPAPEEPESPFAVLKGLKDDG
jgi:uncharacterized metal-binding protein YceD (DUF177 family)